LTEEEQAVLDWLGEYFRKQGSGKSLITVLLALQEKFGYLPGQGMREVARLMGVSAANVYGVATFYNRFRFNPPGRHEIKVCMGTACHIKRADKILDHWKRRLEIGAGEVTPDREYSLERVACVGCCTLAPVTVVGDEVIGNMSTSKIDGILLGHDLDRKQKVDGATRETEGA
jgi:NADH-quinone oxidoreductase subunit E